MRISTRCSNIGYTMANQYIKFEVNIASNLNLKFYDDGQKYDNSKLVWISCEFSNRSYKVTSRTDAKNRM